MGKMIYAGTKSKVPAKKKPGWKEREAEHAAWLAKINQMKLFPEPGKKFKDAVVVRGKKTLPTVNTDSPTITRTQIKGTSVVTPGGSTGRLVVDPRVQYKDNPEMAERELRAREKKFNTAPAYNKGGDVYVSEEELANQLKGNKRRS